MSESSTPYYVGTLDGLIEAARRLFEKSSWIKDTTDPKNPEVTANVLWETVPTVIENFMSQISVDDRLDIALGLHCAAVRRGLPLPQQLDSETEPLTWHLWVLAHMMREHLLLQDDIRAEDLRRLRDRSEPPAPEDI